MRLFNIVVLIVLASFSLKGQNKLSVEELKIFQDRAVEYVYNFEYYVEQIAQTKSVESKSADILAALNLFEEKATIEVSYMDSYKKEIKNKRTIKTYLNNLAKLSDKYEVIVIDFVASKVENLKEKKDENGEIFYEGTFKFTQSFYAEKRTIGSSNIEGRKYKTGDLTRKKGKIILKQVTTVVGDQWILKLGDITVEETKQYD